MKLVYVEWVDSCGHDDWISPAEIEVLDTGQMRSVGWLFKRTPEMTVIVPHAGFTADEKFFSGRGSVAIPNVAITKMRTVVITTKKG